MVYIKITPVDFELDYLMLIIQTFLAKIFCIVVQMRIKILFLILDNTLRICELQCSKFLSKQLHPIQTPKLDRDGKRGFKDTYVGHSTLFRHQNLIEMVNKASKTRT